MSDGNGGWLKRLCRRSEPPIPEQNYSAIHHSKVRGKCGRSDQRQAPAARMVWNRVKFPNMAVTFMGKNARTRLRDNQYVFRVEPNYTKNDIKEYLTKVYNLPVAKVNTMNYEGERGSCS